MAKTVAIFVISAMVIITVAVWITNSQSFSGLEEVLTIGVLVLVIGFAIFIGVRRARGLARKEPVEDELSRNHMRNATSLSYHLSIYFWLFMMYISDKTELESHTLIGAGILGMAVILLLSWVGLRIFGFSND